MHSIDISIAACTIASIDHAFNLPFINVSYRFIATFINCADRDSATIYFNAIKSSVKDVAFPVNHSTNVKI